MGGGGGTERDARDLGGKRRELGLELVVHDEDGKVRALRLALGLGELLELALDVLLELGHGVAVWGGKKGSYARVITQFTAEEGAGTGRERRRRASLLQSLARVVDLVLYF